MNNSSHPTTPNIITKYSTRGFYKWLVEDVPHLRTVFGSNLETLTDEWILDNYNCYNNISTTCRIIRDEGIYTCLNCNSKYIQLHTQQSRKSDEAATTIYICNTCGHRSSSYNIF